MTDKPSEAEEKAAEAEFQRVLGNLAAMPHRPHVNRPEGDSSQTRKKRGAPKSAPKSEQPS
jgi:hypothetical protein